MKTVRVNLSSWQPPSTCACCLQGTSSRVSLSPRGIEIRGVSPVLSLPLCDNCREHVLFAQRGGARVPLATLGGGLVGALAGAAAGWTLGAGSSRAATAAAMGLVLALVLGLVFWRMASRHRPAELLDEQHTRRGTPAEMSVDGQTATLVLHSDVFARLVADAHAPRSASDAPWQR